MACQGATMVDDYCWLPEEFPEEVFFLGGEEEEEQRDEKGHGRVPSGVALGRFGSSGRGVLPAPVPSFPSEFPYDVEPRSLSPSPLGSAAGTDSDDEEEYEDLVAGLTQKMVARKLRLMEAEEGGVSWLPSPGFFAGETHKVSVGMRQYSPQSTLSPAGSWTALGGGRSPTDRDYLFLASRKRDDSALDLLSAAALEVELMRLKDGAAADLRRALAGDGRGLLPGPPGPSPGPHRKNNSAATAASAVGSLNKPAATSFYGAHPAHTHHHYQQQLQSTQPQQRPVPAPAPAAAWSARQSRGTAGLPAAGGRLPSIRPLGSSSSPAYTCPPSTWSLPAQQPHQPLGGSGMRAVFLGGAGARRESSGTGVFLPRRDGNPPAAKKKPACSTVLLPARVVQALNLNLDEIGALPVSSHGAGFVLNSDAIRARSRTAQAQQQQQLRVQNAAAAATTTVHPYPNYPPNPAPAAALSPEIRLPPEWSY